MDLNNMDLNKMGRRFQLMSRVVFCLYRYFFICYLLFYNFFLLFSCHSFQKKYSRQSDWNNITTATLLKKEIQTEFPIISLLENEERKSPHLPDTDLLRKSFFTKESRKISDKQTKKIIDRRPDRQGRPLVSRLSGKELIQDTIWRNGKKIVRTTLMGSAKLYHDRLEMQAHKIVMENRNYATFIGGVRIHDPLNGNFLYAGGAFYDRGRQLIRLTARPYLKNDSHENGKLIMSCDTISYFMNEQKLGLKGDLRGSHLGRYMFADEGVYFVNQKTLILKEDPLFFTQNGQYMTAKELLYHQKKGIVTLRKQVFLYKTEDAFSPFDSKKTRKAPSPKKAKQIGLEDYVRQGGKIEKDSFHTSRVKRMKNHKKKKMQSQKTPPLKYFIVSADSVEYWLSKKIIGKGDVLFTKKGGGGDYYLHTPYLHLFGKKLQDIDAGLGRGVFVEDFGRGLRLKAKSIHFSNESQKLTIKNNAELHFLNSSQKTVAPSTFFGDFIERDFQKKITHAEGNVRIIQKDYEAKANLASYHENAELITMEGSPSVRKKGYRLEAEKIFIYLEKRRIILQNRVKSSFQNF